MSWIMHTFHEWRYPLILALWSFRSRGNREGPASGVDYWTERKEIWTSTNQGKIKFFIIFQGVEEIGSPVNMDPPWMPPPICFKYMLLIVQSVWATFCFESVCTHSMSDSSDLDVSRFYLSTSLLSVLFAWFEMKSEGSVLRLIIGRYF